MNGAPEMDWLSTVHVSDQRTSEVSVQTEIWMLNVVFNGFDQKI